jgi:hypothetical protein
MSVVNFLLNGPIMTAPERREALLERMAKDIAAYHVCADRQDAVRVLHQLGYDVTDIHVLVDDARQVAMQDIVAREMSES